MKGLVFVVFALSVVLIALAVVAKRKGGKTAHTEKPRATWPLSKNEQAMFFRLQGALPELIVLSQVSFSALLTARSKPVRNTFDRKRADFVVCERSFKVVAVVELDDSSHDGNADRDSKRAAMLTDAGYRLLRYRGIPDIDKVRADFAPPAPPPTMPTSDKSIARSKIATIRSPSSGDLQGADTRASHGHH